MRSLAAILALGAMAASQVMANVLDGFRDCVRADDGRPVCISNATGSYHFVTEQFFARYESHTRAAAPEISPVQPVPEPVPAQNTAPVAASSHSTSLSAEDLYAAASRSIVVIGVIGTRDADEAFFGQGSGVVVKPGRVVTNCHVVESAHAAGVFYQGEYFGSVSIVDAHPARDLCLLDAGSLPAPPIRLGTVSSLRIGQQVFAIGAPQGLDIGLDLTLSEGLVSALRRKEGETLPLIQTSAPISQGSSGGALLASDGSLVGITTMVHKTGQNLNFAVPADWIRDFPGAR